MSMDAVAGYQLERAPVRGRIARLGPASIDPILRRHAYPRPVAFLLGEALTWAAMMGAMLKGGEGLSIQAEGDGPVRLLVADCRVGGGLRGYVRLAEDAHLRLGVDHALAPAALIGAGALALTLDQGPDMDQMQAFVPLEGDSLAACAETYFRQSEQTPTLVRIAVAEEIEPRGLATWRGGGVLMQRIAGDDRRGLDEDGWAVAQAHFATITDVELVDWTLPPDRLLYRLFHEIGVRMAEPQPLEDRCTCDEGRLAAILQRFDATERAEMTGADGLIEARCQFCARQYRFSPAV